MQVVVVFVSGSEMGSVKRIVKSEHGFRTTGNDS